MSKPKDQDSWKGRAENYKRAKREPIIDEQPQKHKKKKKKKNKKSKHKHEYVPAVYDITHTTNLGEQKKYQTYGSHCKECGKVKDMHFLWFESSRMKLENFKQEYPNWVEIVLPDGWDYFKDKYIPI